MNKSNTLNKVIVLTVLALSAFGVSVLAQTTWVSSPGAPSTCPPGYSGCDAPINVGSTPQTRLGPLKIGLDASNNVTGALSVGGLGIFSSNFVYKPSSDPVVTGSVLTALDPSGKVSWQAPGAVTPTCRLIAGTATGPDWQSIPTPSECIDNTCSLALAVFHTSLGTVNTVRSTMLTQFSGTFPFGSDGPNWWVKPGSTNDGTSCALGRNGTTQGCDGIINYNDSIILYDDNTSGESNADQWTLRDTASNYRANLYVCR